jgi:hypothetical protein
MVTKDVVSFTPEVVLAVLGRRYGRGDGKRLGNQQVDWIRRAYRAVREFRILPDQNYTMAWFCRIAEDLIK